MSATLSHVQAPLGSQWLERTAQFTGVQDCSLLLPYLQLLSKILVFTRAETLFSLSDVSNKPHAEV
jgi:hypothetical protein